MHVTISSNSLRRFELSFKEVNSMNGSDHRGLDYNFRHDTLGMIRTKLHELARKANEPDNPEALNLAAKSFEAKIYENATSRQDYLQTIESKLASTHRGSSSVYTTGNHSGSTVIQRPAHQNIAEQKPNMIPSHYQQPRMLRPPPLSSLQSNMVVPNHQIEQQNLPNMISGHYQQPWMIRPPPLLSIQSNMAVPNHQIGQQNQPLGQQNQPLWQQNQQFVQQNGGQQNKLSGQQNQQFVQQNGGQQNQQLGQQNRQGSQQNGQFGQQNHQLGQVNGQPNVVQRDNRYQLAQQNGYKQSLECRPLVNPQQVTYHASQAQYSSPLVNPQGHRNPVTGMSTAYVRPENPAAYVRPENPVTGISTAYVRPENPATGISTAYVRPENYGVTNNLIPPQSRMPSTTGGASAPTPFSDAGATSTDELLSIAHLQHVRSSYLPELYRRHKTYNTYYTQAQTVYDRDKYKRDITFIEDAIRYLTLPDNQLISSGKEKVRHHLNYIIKYCNQKSTSSGVKQPHQVSSLQMLASTSVAQNTQSVPAPINQPIVSSSTINPGPSLVDTTSSGVIQPQQVFSLQRLVSTSVAQNTQSVPTLINQPIVSSSTTNPGSSIVETSAQSLLPRGSADQNTHLNMKSGPEKIQSAQTDQRTEMPQAVNLPEKRGHPMPETENDFMDLMSKLATNASTKLPETSKDPIDPTVKTSPKASSTVAKKPCSKPRVKSSGSTHDSWLNLAGVRSKKRLLPSKLSQCTSVNDELKRDTPPISQSQPSVLLIDSPSTPATPSISQSKPSVLLIDSPSTPVAPSSVRPQEQPKLEERPPLLGSPETLLGSPVVSGFMAPESSQQHPEKRPIDRLLDAVKSASKETLVSAADDMRAAVIEMDKLPDYAYLNPIDAFVLTLDDDLVDFFECLLYESHYSMDEEPEQPKKKRRREFVSVSRDISSPFNNPDPPQSSGFLPNSAAKQSTKSEPNQTLLDELNETNVKLFWTVVKVVTDPSNQSNGTVVRCTYKPIAVRADILRSLFATDSINLSIEFLVPSDYPTAPPKILDCKLPDFGIAREMTEKAKSLFDTQVRCVDPLRVRGMGKVWDLCARSVFAAYAKRCGAETLFPNYGGFERF